MPSSNIQVITVTECSNNIMNGIGRLMPQLDPDFSSEPMSEKRLTEVIESPYHDQLVALNQAHRVVGSASLSVVIGSGVHLDGRSNRKGQLEDFVVDKETRRQGVAALLWEGVVQWCNNHELEKLIFQTEEERVAAVAFYQKMGAVTLDGTHHLEFLVSKPNPHG